MKTVQIWLGVSLVLASVLAQLNQTSFSANGYTQIILPFKTEKQFHYDWNQPENTLILQFPSTNPNELEAFNNYDERLVRRMIVKDLGPAGTEVHLVLKDRNVRALVTSFKDPFRIAVDLFDKDFSEKKDPATGLPVSDLTVEAVRPASNRGSASLAESSPSSTANTKPETAHSSENHSPAQASSGKRRLLQALPEEINSANELKAALANIAPGVGKAWIGYPPYVYRAQLAPYEGREVPDREISPLQTQAIKTSSAMATYAGKLYDFGHEGRALLAYQQVLLKEPGVFEKDPVHLWKFAEAHLGQGNLQLAEGYYTSLLDKHPTHALARFAHLRKIDVEAIKLSQKGEAKSLSKLVPKLSAAANKPSAEITAQTLIRKAWWTDPLASQDRLGKLPNASEDIQRGLSAAIPNVESQRTAFLASSLVANRMTQMETPWEASYAKYLNDYLSTYKGSAADPYRESISSAAKERLAAEFKNQFAAKNYMGIVSLFEALPEPMKSIRKTKDVSWALGESYRAVGQTEKAVPFYQTASEGPAGIDTFKAKFWLSHLAGTVALDYQAKRGNQERIRTLNATSIKADGELVNIWTKLKSDEKAQIQTAMAEVIEANVASDLKTKTAPRILLEKYASALTVNPPKLSTSSGTNPTDLVGNFSPTATTVHLLDDLGKKFAALGMQPERRRSLELMRFIKPASIEQDKSAQKIWTDQLLGLAEEHRKANEFLEAGELYSMIGESGASIENRAEANYKGGLLLYRAGRKQDAIKALEKAKADPNNLFYSKLASERLDQLQAH